MAIRGAYKRIPTMRTLEDFTGYLAELGIDLPVDATLDSGPSSPLGSPIDAGPLHIGNRWTIHPMEGWDGTTDGLPTDNTVRRWRRFGESGAKLIWGGEAVAVRPDGRANPNQLMINESTRDQIARLRDVLIAEHEAKTGSSDGLVVGLQLTHSGRFCRPNRKDTLEPKIAYAHPVLNRKFNLPDDYPVMTDDDLKDLISHYHRAAKLAAELGFDFVDIKHCHGYLGHELLSAYDRPGEFGGSFENRTRFLRDIVEGIRADSPDLQIGVRLSAFDFLPFKPDPELTEGPKIGPGIPEEYAGDTYPGFGCERDNPLAIDLTGTKQFLKLLESMDIKLVNLTAGSPYYNPHIQRPALYPPSDGYQPPEDPLVGVARQIHAVKDLKQAFPNLVLVGTGYTYLQEYLPNVAQAVVRQGWVDSVGIGRMVLSYPDMCHDVVAGNELQTKKICRTFSDCTTAPRNGLVSGCYPLDDHYKKSDEFAELRVIKSGKGSK
jgi:NADPH2 dehydrogenase